MSRQRSIEKIQASDYVSIGELARLTGCRYSTLKFYTEEGMLPFEQPEGKPHPAVPAGRGGRPPARDSEAESAGVVHPRDQGAAGNKRLPP